MEKGRADPVARLGVGRALQPSGKEAEGVGDVLRPVGPLVSAGEFLVGMRDPCGLQLSVQDAVGADQFIRNAAVEAQWRQFGAGVDDGLVNA